MESCLKAMQSFFKKYVVQHLTRRLFLILFFGQILSLLVCAVGTSSQKLVIDCHIKVAAFQGFLSYFLLSIVFTTKLAYDWQNFLDILKRRWWKYMLIGCIDVEANFMVYTAYQYTSLTSVQLLDCLSIPVVVILSIMVLKAKYRAVHFMGILVCLTGMGILVWADISQSRNQGPSAGVHSEIIGDVLVIGGAILYGFLNITEEFIVKTSSITEFLGMLSFFACIFSGVNVMALERHAVASIVWNFEVVFLLALNAVAMLAFYVLTPVLIYHSSATLVNLTLLTADLYSLFVGLYLFNYTFSHLYIMSFVIIVVGVIIFKVFPTPSRIDVEPANPINQEEEEQEILAELSDSLDNQVI